MVAGHLQTKKGYYYMAVSYKHLDVYKRQAFLQHEFATGIHLFLIAGSIYWVTRTPRLNLLKSNAAIRGWLTVFVTDIEAQGGIGQPVAQMCIRDRVDVS